MELGTSTLRAETFILGKNIKNGALDFIH